MNLICKSFDPIIENHLENGINDTTQIKNPHFFFTLVYIELFSAIRSSGINDIFYPHGLCVSYDRILRITHGLGEALLQLFQDNYVVIPRLLWTGLFKVGAKDKTDKNACSTISKYDYHGASVSLFQFSSSFNDGFERSYQQFVKISSSRSKNVGEISLLISQKRSVTLILFLL